MHIVRGPDMALDNQGTSTRPYLLRALHDWCTDNGFTPYIAVSVGPGVQVPMEYVKNNEIVLNVGFDATSSLQLGNETIEFKARFGGIAREIIVPVDHVVAIYARENGQGMAFPMPTEGAAQPVPTEAERPGPRGLRLASSDTQPSGVPRLAEAHPSEPPPPEPPDPASPGGGRPALKRIK
jgi:stringent starvation protein B